MSYSIAVSSANLNSSVSTLYFSPAYYHDPSRTYAFPYYVNPVHFVHSNYFPSTNPSDVSISPVHLVIPPSILNPPSIFLRPHLLQVLKVLEKAAWILATGIVMFIFFDKILYIHNRIPTIIIISDQTTPAAPEISRHDANED